MIKYILKLFGYKIMSIKDYDASEKMSTILTSQYKNEVRILALEPDTVKALEIKARVRMERDMERMMWMGIPILIDIDKGKITPIITNPPIA